MQNQYNIYIHIKHTTASKMHWNYVDDSNVIEMQYFKIFFGYNKFIITKNLTKFINKYKKFNFCLDIFPIGCEKIGIF